MLLLPLVCVLLFGVNANAYSVDIKSLHAIIRDKMICIEMSKSIDAYDNAWVDRINLTLSLVYYKNNTLTVPLQNIDKCLSGTTKWSAKDSVAEFVCGIYDDPLPGTNSNLDMYKNMKIQSIEGRVEMLVEYMDEKNTTTQATNNNITRLTIDTFHVHARGINVHLHGYDPCRYHAKSDEVCGNKCKPLCELYATGEGMFRCGDTLKKYNKYVGNDIEVSHGPLDFSVQKLHMDRMEKLFCVQVTTNVRSTCYAEYDDQTLRFFSPGKQMFKTVPARRSCHSLFYTSGYPGTFCYTLKTTRRNRFRTYFPETLVLHNLTMYCDDFSQFQEVKEINLFGEEMQRYNMMMTYDICPHAVKEKGNRPPPRRYQLKGGYLIQEKEGSGGNQKLAVLIVACCFIVLVIVCLLLFFLCKVRKSCDW